MTDPLPAAVEKAMFTYTADVDRHARKDENLTDDRKEWLACSERSREVLVAEIGKAIADAVAMERREILDVIENATESDVDPYRNSEVDEEAIWKACAELIRARANAKGGGT